MNNELKPCPFCGAKENDERSPFLYIFKDKLDNKMYYQIKCYNCSAQTRMNISKESAIYSWNKRAKNEII